MIKFFNTLTRKLDDFVPLTQGEVKMYSCGPTVYDVAHIGNLRAYVFVDLLKRYLKYSGYKVRHVMNITDIDDKTIKGSQQKGQSLLDFTQFYTHQFLSDLAAMGIQLPDVTPTASTHISEMIKMIEVLVSKGLAYVATDGSVYYKIANDPQYGQLAGLDRQSLKVNADGRLNQADEYDKESVNDFALWRAYTPNDGEVKWESPWGPGRPGWHIECSAMSTKYLGEQFDIHTGGVDLIFPHHTNEIAQSEGALGHPFVNYWLHNAHLTVDGAKMSKSKGNFYTLGDLVKQDVNPLLLRLVFLKFHYRQMADYTAESLEEARGIARKFLETLLSLPVIPANAGTQVLQSIGATGSPVEAPRMTSIYMAGVRQKFQSALNDDLNVSAAFTVLFEFMDNVNKNLKTMSVEEAQAVKNFIFEIDEVLGFIKPLYDQYQTRLNEATADPAVKTLLNERAAARIKKDFTAADALRVKLQAKGLSLSDTPSGQQLRLTNVI